MLKGFDVVGLDCFWRGASATYPDRGWPPATGPVLGTHYQPVSSADVDYMTSKGANASRVLFSWEAIQPTPFANIPGTGNFGTYFAKFKALVDLETSKGKEVLIDIHPQVSAGFAAYWNVKVGQSYQGTPVEDLLVDLWTKLAVVFKDNPRVHIGFYNEPIGVTAPVWFACVQKIITAVRNAGFKGWLVPPGVNWTHALTWVSSGSAAEFLKLRDPLGKLAFQVHEYADNDAGGSTTGIVSETILVERLKPAVEWAKANNAKVWLTEVGFQGSATSSVDDRLWANLMTYLRANESCVIGWLWWNYGVPRVVGNDLFAGGPKTVGGPDSPQMDVIEAELAKPETIRFPVAIDWKAKYDEAYAALEAAESKLALANKALSAATANTSSLEGRLSDALRARDAAVAEADAFKAKLASSEVTVASLSTELKVSYDKYAALEQVSYARLRDLERIRNAAHAVADNLGLAKLDLEAL